MCRRTCLRASRLLVHQRVQPGRRRAGRADSARRPAAGGGPEGMRGAGAPEPPQEPRDMDAIVLCWDVAERFCLEQLQSEVLQLVHRDFILMSPAELAELKSDVCWQRLLQLEFMPLIVGASCVAFLEHVRFLARKGADVDQSDATGRTALSEALSSHHNCAIVEALLTAGASKIQPIASRGGRSAIVIAASAGCVRCLENLSKGAGAASVVAADRTGVTPLYAACHFGRLGVVSHLIRAGVMVSLQLPERRGRTPLIIASVKGHADCVAALLNAGADAYIKDGDGRSALHEACCRGHTTVAELLCMYDTTPGTKLVNAVDKSSLSALCLAALKGHADVIRVLCRYGADALHKDAEGHTTLHTACALGLLAVAELLVQHDVTENLQLVNALDSGGASALHLVSKLGEPRMVRLLLENGARVDQQNGLSMTPLHEACLHGCEATAKLLMEWGADPRIECATGSAYSMADALVSHSLYTILFERAKELDAAEASHASQASGAAQSSAGEQQDNARRDVKPLETTGAQAPSRKRPRPYS